MNKTTQAVIKGRQDALLHSLINKYGMPVCYEDLTIYFVNDAQNIKLSVQPLEDLVVSFRNSEGAEQYYYRTKPGEIKSVIKSLYGVSGGEGYISISDIKKFIINDQAHIKLIDTRRAGYICTHYGFSYDQAKQDLEGFCAERKQSKDDGKLDKIISFDISNDGILNSKVLQYLDRNGIYYRVDNIKPTYRQLMNAKSNDYSIYEPSFELMTGRSIVDSRPVVDGIKYVRNQSVSIIIPYFNSESSILKVFECINNQTGIDHFKSVEVILIDDHSETPFAETIALNKNQYKFNLKVIRHEQNYGVSTSREVGTALSTGDLLVYLDSDILLEKNYLVEHAIRMLAIPNAVFVSLKENVEETDPRVAIEKIKSGLNRPNSFNDLRVYKKITTSSVGSYTAINENDTRILESTNYLKSFNGSKVYGIYDLSCMVVGHNFSTKKPNIVNSRPFTSIFRGWGMEDVYSGLRFINSGIYIIPVVSTGVYHLNHRPRSGSEQKKKSEYAENISIIDKLLDSPYES